MESAALCASAILIFTWTVFCGIKAGGLNEFLGLGKTEVTPPVSIRGQVGLEDKDHVTLEILEDSTGFLSQGHSCL